MKFTRRFARVLVALLALSFASTFAMCVEPASPPTGGFAPARHFLMYVGTYTGARSKGIHAWRLDSLTGALTPLGLVAETPNPTFLAIHPSHRFLYAANEISELDGKPGGAVSGFAIDAKSGKLALLNQASTVGPGPCHLVVDKSGHNVLVANYGLSSLWVFATKAYDK